jgi:hypothetical protein
MMDQEIKTNISFVLKSLIKILSSKNISSSDLKSLGNRLMDNISLFKDKNCISLSVLIHSLYKIFSKNSEMDRSLLKGLIEQALRNINSDLDFENSLKSIFVHIKKYDDNLDRSVIQILRHAQIKKGLKVYEYGVSIGEAANTIGVSRWEILEYLGSSTIIDREGAEPTTSKQRFLFTRGIFK